MSHEAYACCKSSSDGRPREHTWPEQGAPSRHATPRWTPRVAGARRPGTLYNRGQCRHKDSGAYRYPDLKGAHDHDQATALCWACITKQVWRLGNNVYSISSTTSRVTAGNIFFIPGALGELRLGPISPRAPSPGFRSSESAGKRWKCIGVQVIRMASLFGF